MTKKVEDKKITQIYYWKDNNDSDIFKIQICYNNNFMEVKNGNINYLKELEQLSGIKPKKV
jgi:hypothetical protein